MLTVNGNGQVTSTGNFVDQNQDTIGGESPSTFYQLTSATIATDSFGNSLAGSNYSPGETLTVNILPGSGGLNVTPAQLLVTSVNSNGGILTFTIENKGSYSQSPQPTGIYYTVTGAGSGTEFNLTFTPSITSGDVFSIPTPTNGRPSRCPTARTPCR